MSSFAPLVLHITVGCSTRDEIYYGRDGCSLVPYSWSAVLSQRQRHVGPGQTCDEKQVIEYYCCSQVPGRRPISTAVVGKGYCNHACRPRFLSYLGRRIRHSCVMACKLNYTCFLRSIVVLEHRSFVVFSHYGR